MTNPPSEAAKLLPCPFCGSVPKIQLGKKTFCQLHGEPAQCVIVRCANPYCCRPEWSAGDVYNGGYKKAETEVIEKWNTRAHDAEIRREALEDAKIDAMRLQLNAAQELAKEFEFLIQHFNCAPERAINAIVQWRASGGTP